MTGRRDRLAENAGSALAAAGAVLAVGAALGAVGLAEVRQGSPFRNLRVRVAMVILVGVALWCIYVFAVAMRSTLKTQRFREQAVRQSSRGRVAGTATLHQRRLSPGPIDADALSTPDWAGLKLRSSSLNSQRIRSNSTRGKP
jgi:hypothetical protein